MCRCCLALQQDRVAEGHAAGACLLLPFWSRFLLCSPYTRCGEGEAEAAAQQRLQLIEIQFDREVLQNLGVMTPADPG